MPEQAFSSRPRVGVVKHRRDSSGQTTEGPYRILMRLEGMFASEKGGILIDPGAVSCEMYPQTI